MVQFAYSWKCGLWPLDDLRKISNALLVLEVLCLEQNGVDELDECCMIVGLLFMAAVTGTVQVYRQAAQV